MSAATTIAFNGGGSGNSSSDGAPDIHKKLWLGPLRCIAPRGKVVVDAGQAFFFAQSAHMDSIDRVFCHHHDFYLSTAKD